MAADPAAAAVPPARIKRRSSSFFSRRNEHPESRVVYVTTGVEQLSSSYLNCPGFPARTTPR
jgi:hypothetical protein